MGQYFPVDLPRNAPPEFGHGAVAVRVQKIPLDDARTQQRMIVKGNFLWVVDASDISANLDVQFNDRSSAPWPLRRGTSLAGVPFSEIYLTNTAQAGKYLTLLTCVEGREGVRAVNPDSNQNEVQLYRGTTIAASTVTVATATTTALATADSTRRSLSIHNPHATAVLYVGQAGITTNGFPIQPLSYATMTFSPTAAFYAYQASGVSIDVPIFEESD